MGYRFGDLSCTLCVRGGLSLANQSSGAGRRPILDGRQARRGAHVLAVRRNKSVRRADPKPELALLARLPLAGVGPDGNPVLPRRVDGRDRPAVDHGQRWGFAPSLELIKLAVDAAHPRQLADIGLRGNSKSGAHLTPNSDRS